jgi:hypothetical protein
VAIGVLGVRGSGAGSGVGPEEGGDVAAQGGEIEKGMATLVKLTKQLDEEWEAEAKLRGEVSTAFDLLDVLIAAAAQAGKG